jgi:hypothetical protein
MVFAISARPGNICTNCIAALIAQEKQMAGTDPGRDKQARAQRHNGEQDANADAHADCRPGLKH